MSTGRQTMRDLVEEAKKRVVLLLICVFGLSYLMSLTSSSVWANLPVAAAAIIASLYLLRELDIRRKATDSNIIPTADESSRKISVELFKFPLEKLDWRKKVNSPVVEEAIDQFTRHLVSEWIVDLWYSRITPDRDGPDELVEIMNGVIGEISCRARDVNLIDLLSRDVVNLICNHLQLYRYSQAKIGKQEIMKLPTDQRDTQLKLILAAENKLHPALVSIEAEHKVLQNLATGLMSIAFKPEDLQCSFFCYTVRELLACTVLRPVLNLVNPRFINEKIESLALSHANKASKRFAPSAAEAPIVKRRAHLVSSDDQISGSLDHSTPGVELVPFKTDTRKTGSDEISTANGMRLTSKGNDSWFKPGSTMTSKINNFPINSDFTSKEANSLLAVSQYHDGKKIGAYASGSEWAQMLDTVSKRKSQALAPEHLDNVWAKGRNYKRREGSKSVISVAENSSLVITTTHPGATNQVRIHTDDTFKKSPKLENLHATDCNGASHSNPSFQQKAEHGNHEEVESVSESSYTTEDDENSTVTGLNSPGTRVWESINKKNAGGSSIRHPLETSEIHAPKRSGKIHQHRTSRKASGKRRSRSGNQKDPLWQEVERTSFLLGAGHDILNSSKQNRKMLELSDDSDVEVRGKIHSGTMASSVATSESSLTSMKSSDILVLADTFLTLRCEVLGANIVKSGSGTLAVYSISVTDANNNSWFIKRRFRHFEELHRRLKEFPEYNLHLPPKHFLSSGLDVPVVQERCKLLDIYLKKLLQIPSISESIEVWDFLSIDSQTYVFSDSLSIIQTISVNLDDKTSEKNAKGPKSTVDVDSQSFSTEKILNSDVKDDPKLMGNFYHISDGLRLRKPNMEQISGLNTIEEQTASYENYSESDSEIRLNNNVSSTEKSNHSKEDLTEGAETVQKSSKTVDAVGALNIPNEWVPPNLSIPILNLVDVIFQLKDSGWIRRQTFWIAKQLLQLGMGDAFDDWLIEKIQLLRRGVVIASAIKRIEQLLWPDGIFLTKHPKRKAGTPVSLPGTQNNQKDNPLSIEQQLEADRRAKFVYELIIDKAPAALVSLVGRKEYEHCAQDIYFFLQSPVCLKQFALELLELLLLSVFPELDDVVRECHREDQQLKEGNR